MVSEAVSKGAAHLTDFDNLRGGYHASNSASIGDLSKSSPPARRRRITAPTLCIGSTAPA
jgi:hypothetical protein